MKQTSQIAAFFDLDGTLLPPPSLERRFLRFLRWRKELTASRRLRWIFRFIVKVGENPLAATHGNKAYYAGLPIQTMDAWLDFLRRHPPTFFPGAVERLSWHALQHHRIFIVSGTLRPLAGAAMSQIAPHLERVSSHPLEICATELEIRANKFTGNILGEPLCGTGKFRAIERLAKAHSLDLSRSFAYADSFLDRHVLRAVGRPFAVNPSPLLSAYARACKWPILVWSAEVRPLHRGAGSQKRPRPTLCVGRASTALPKANAKSACFPRDEAFAFKSEI